MKNSEDDEHTRLQLTGVWKTIPSDDELQEVAERFRLLGDPTRIKILSSLSLGGLCVHATAEAVGTTPSAISHQLRWLRQAKIVTARKDGKETFYSIRDVGALDLISLALNHVRRIENKGKGAKKKLDVV